VLAASLALYAATCHFDWNLTGYPAEKVWFFNPMAWQVVFYTGAVMAVMGPGITWMDRWRWPVSIAAFLYLCFAAFIALSWHYNWLESLIPDIVARQIYPIDKTNVDILRFLHFLAIAWFVRARPPTCAGGSSSHFAGAGSIRCRYSASVPFLLSVPRSSTLTLKGRSCLSSSSASPASPS
jgi:hypothetical protein